MGSEGSIGAELDSGMIGVRKKTLKVPASSEPTGSGKDGLATLRCANAGVGVASCVTTLMTFRSIRPERRLVR